MLNYNLIATTPEYTVLAEFSPEPRRAAAYQSEAELEREFIERLVEQGYERLDITSEAALIANLRRQLEDLNGITFSNAEWERFFRECIANASDGSGIAAKTRRIQDDHVQLLKRDDGTIKNVSLIDKKSIHNNRLQVINQYAEGKGAHAARYDVTVLVNGLPLVHIELKRRGVAIREAFNQIGRYQRDSFWAASGLFEYVQIFVISNGTHTKYYSATTREAHVLEFGRGERRKSKKRSNSFEFTSFWADSKNRPITDLVDFTKTFFAKHTLLSILVRYCVYTSERELLVMRPYQIAATERILGHLVVSANYKRAGTVGAGGFIWHTTGSGKTLTSFKTAQLATELDTIDKVLFVVDRKDLDYQTMKEYDRFEKGAANGNVSTEILKKQLEDPDARIIVTTIQKIGVFIKKYRVHDVYRKRLVMIFDECHRSQFGELHRKIVKAFKSYYIFGFTGTPIFAASASGGGGGVPQTTEQVFGEKLHTYTIVDAINDENVLPFRIDYASTIKEKEGISDKRVTAIDIERALCAPERISMVTAYILEHFDQKTKRSAGASSYEHRVITNVGAMAESKHNTEAEKKAPQRVTGFNSIFAVSSIPMAKKYYEEFRAQLAKSGRKLSVAVIFSYSANEDDIEDALPDEDFDNDRLDKSSRDFLEAAIGDYNAMFATNYDTSSDKFQNYYKDVSMRVKNREVDLLIVVNMFLTGFDATTLNTLWVDKNLRRHGLIQAFSRTNRILNSVKAYGNIVCFRDLKEATDAALAMFGDKDASGVVLLRTYNEYYHGYEQKEEQKAGYAELIAELTARFPLGFEIMGEAARRDFIGLYGAILRVRNILTAFDEFDGNEILTEREFQDYQSVYIDIYQEIRPRGGGDKEDINDDIVFEIELIRQIEVNIDYILMLVEKYRESNCKNKDVLVSIGKAINSSIELRSKKELIERFIERLNASPGASGDWQSFVNARKEEELSALIAGENLDDEEARKFVDIAFRDGALKTTGTGIDKLLPPMSRFGGGDRDAKKQGVIERLEAFFEKYSGLV